ncbi:uncharacterized protein LOC119724020 [Patiria miniata]|uniref:Uncharacterized protein n=1 Tax=Patiria miniata TaxID=46514 RepID=A0A913ZHJ9_PATMI|nr:uncharacterized protein LOC119724020 [Patiria miniata]
MRKLLKDTGEELLQAGIEVALNFVLNDLGIPKEFLSDKEPCLAPTSMSHLQLIAALEERQLAITGTRMELEARLSQDDRSCQFSTLPVFPPELAKVAYCSLSENCLRLDCCLELNIKKLKFRRSFKAFVEVDACDFTFYIAFQHLQYKKLLLSYEWGKSQQQSIGPITLKYSINKLDAEKVFEVDFGASICQGADDCIFDVDIIQDYRVPIPFCNSNFSFALPGGNNLRDFLDQVGRNAGQEVVNVFLEFIGLRDKINDGQCDTGALVSVDEEGNGTVRGFLQMVGRNAADSAVDAILEHLGLSVSHFCQYMVIDKSDAEESFRINLGISICIDSECTTTSVLQDFLVPIPFCNLNASFELPGRRQLWQVLPGILPETLGSWPSRLVSKNLEYRYYFDHK